MDENQKLKKQKQPPPSEEKNRKVRYAFRVLNRKFEEQETQRKAKELGMPYFDLAGFPIEEQVLAVVPKERAEAALAIPFDADGSLLKLAVVDPFKKELDDLRDSLGERKYEIDYYLVSRGAFEEALKQYIRIVEVKETGGEHKITVSFEGSPLKQFKDLARGGLDAQHKTTTKILELILGSAMFMQSSDIHIEPEKEKMKLRFRVDGVLQDIASLPKDLHKSILSRIKLLSGLKLNVTSVPQDGRFSVVSPAGEVEIRVSVLPTAHGESVVMRILGMQIASLDIETLGLRERDYRLVLSEIRKPNGMILTTGPTGSGKTTTLYSFLSYLNKPGVKVITLEDPVEYELEGIIQTPIDHRAGMDFAKGLRSILRQDPDIIMVGEIRDFETAETAAQAALTGHVVLSTLHTNDAAGAIPRLLDMGVKPVTLAPALNALMAQRLLRKICQHCREPYQPGVQEFDRIKMIISRLPAKIKEEVSEPPVFYHSKGCEKCHTLGYSGRIGVFEVFSVDESIEQLIFKQAPTHEIKKRAIEMGMTTMQQDAVLKAMKGETDLAEVWRVTEE